MAGAEPAEEFASNLLQQSTVKILENIGFTSVSDDSLNTITDVMRRYLEQICIKAKTYSEHAGRISFTVEDISLAFNRMQISGVELHEYRRQTLDLTKCEPGIRATPPCIPRLPVRKPGSRVLVYVEPSEKERLSRMERESIIPPNFPTLHLDYCKTDINSDDKPSTSTAIVGSPEKKNVKQIDEFPSFMDMDAIQLGIVKKAVPPPQAVIPKIDHSSATGIKSSANAYAKKVKQQQFKAINPFSTVQSKSARPSPSPAAMGSPVPSPTPPASSFVRRVESTPNLDRLANGISKEATPPIKLQLTIPKSEKPVLSPLVMHNQIKNERTDFRLNNHLLNDIPVLAKIEPLQPSVIDRFDSFQLEDVNMATPEYRMEDLCSIKDESSQPHILLPVKAEAKKDKKKKEKKKHKEKHKEKERPASIAPLLEPIPPLSPRTIETPPMRLEKNEDNTTSVATTSTAPESLCSPKIRITLRNVHSDSPSSAFSPPEATIVAPMETPQFSMAVNPFLTRPPQSISRGSVQSDSNTIPLIDGGPPDEPTVHSMLGDDISINTTIREETSKLQTTFPLNLSMDDPVDEERQKKKAKKKDKDRERDASRLDERGKEKKRDKEHKKKKKKDKNRDRDLNEIKEDKINRSVTGTPDVKYPTLKIKLCSPQSEPTPPSQPSPTERVEPFKIKFKPVVPSEVESRRESLKVNISLPKPQPKEEKSEKPRVKTKAELKAPPVDYPPLFSVDTKIIRGPTPKFDKERNRKSNTSTPVPPLSARNSPAPPPISMSPVKFSIKKETVVKEEKRKKDKPPPTPKVPPTPKATPTSKTLSITKAPNTPKILVPQKEKKKENMSVMVPVITESPKKNKKEKKLANNAKHDSTGEEDRVWICPVCSVAYVDGANMVACDVCDDWYHWNCVGLLVAPPDDVPWFCEKCNKKNTSGKPEKRKSTVVGGSSAKKKKKH